MREKIIRYFGIVFAVLSAIPMLMLCAACNLGEDNKSGPVLIDAQTPDFLQQPINGTYVLGSAISLTAEARVDDGGTLTYQWYRVTSPTSTGGTLIEGADGSAYQPEINQRGAYHFYVVVTNTNHEVSGRKVSDTSSSPVTINIVTSAPTANATVTVNTAVKFQYVRGFGGMDVAWGNFPKINIDDYETMFNPGKLGYNMMRTMIMPDSTDHNVTLNNLIAGDRPHYIEGVKIVNKYGGYVLASPWTPPAVWKTNNSINSGEKLKPENYQDYANYLKSFCNIMAQKGAPIYAISIQNEPNYAAGYDGCEWSDNEMRDFFVQVGHFTDGTTGWGGGSVQPYVRTMNGESTNSPDINNAALEDPRSRDAIDLLGRHLYGSRQQKLENLYGKEMWMTEHNINSANIDIFRDSAWNYVWRFMNNVDLSIRLNNESAFIWWAAKRFYSMIGDGQSGTTEGAVLPRGHGLSHYAKFASNTNRVEVTASGATGSGDTITDANFNHTIDDINSNAVKVSAFESPDGNSISLVMFTPTIINGNNGVNMGTVKIQLPAGFVIRNATAMRSTESLQSRWEDVIIDADNNSAFVKLPASNIVSVKLTK